jgi:DNA-binding Lrp family transcriptional regulator
MSTMVTHFRPQRPGPEAIIQDIVAQRIPQLFSASCHQSWTGASVPLGAGIPDLVVASYYPQVFGIAHVDLSDARILAYLRAVGRARLDTIAQRMGNSAQIISRRLAALLEAEAVVVQSSDTFLLSPRWREILPEIITIEVKVSKWQRAVEQAARNRIFAHRSFVALPVSVARRIRTEPVFRQLGLGLLSVSKANSVSIVRRARRRQPVVWLYYYRLASILARNCPN